MSAGFRLRINTGKREEEAAEAFMTRLGAEYDAGGDLYFDPNGVAVHIAAVAVRRLCKKVKCEQDIGLSVFQRCLWEVLAENPIITEGQEDVL